MTQIAVLLFRSLLQEIYSYYYTSIKPLSILRPVFPLFSGWNCVPYTHPLSTEAVSGIEYSVVAVVLSVQSFP